MSDYFQMTCTHCHGLIEVPHSAQGTSVECPLCQAQVVIPDRKVRKRLPMYVVWLLIGVAVVAVGTQVFWGKLKKDKKGSTSSFAVTTNAAVAIVEAKPKSRDDLQVSAIGVDDPKGGGLRYATGTIKNDSDHPRYGITIELTLIDKNGQALSTKASDYVQMLEPRKEWRFRALVLESKATSARLASIREEE